MRRPEAHAQFKILVGFIVPEDTAFAAEAESLIAGFELFLMENKVSSVEILKKSAGSNGKETLTGLAELVMKHEVRFLVSPPTLSGSEKCIHGIPPGKVVLFVTNPAVRLVSGEMCIPGAFRLGANTYQSARPLAPWSLTNLGRKVFITGVDDSQGNEQADFFAYGFERAGGQFADREMVRTDGKDTEPLLNSIRKSNADFVFASFRGGTAEAFLKAVQSASPGLGKPVVGPESLTCYPEPLTSMGDAGFGVKTLGTLRDAAAFARKVEKHTGTRVTNAVRAAEGYDTASIVFKAAESGNAANGETENLIKFIEQTEIDGPRGKIRFDKNHEPILDMFVQQWESGKRGPRQRIVQELGTVPSLDFGCGRVGFPKKTDLELQDEKRREEQSDEK
ncbi:MAG: ABC transporter substrate-binding protein [Desulfomonilaceae bacterium]|nr:ABC transporter substrate-binding protein [Desulfomonilaceae bacterium]